MVVLKRYVQSFDSTEKGRSVDSHSTALDCVVAVQGALEATRKSVCAPRRDIGVVRRAHFLHVPRNSAPELAREHGY